MAFSATLEQLVSIGDQQGTFWRSFLQALIDHGGDTMHLDELLKDTSGDRRLLDAFARRVIGPIWEYALNKRYLGAIDHDCSFKEFMDKYPTVNVWTGARENNSSRWVGTQPKRSCQYRLFHFNRPMSFNGIVGASLGSGVEYAGARELIAYVSRLQPNDMSHCNIVAAGSQWGACGSIQSSFPVAHPEPKRICVTWHGVDDSNRDGVEYKTEHFYLVRIYD